MPYALNVAHRAPGGESPASSLFSASVIGGTFRSWRVSEGAIQLHFPCKHTEGLFGGTFRRWMASEGARGSRMPSSYIFPVNTVAIGARPPIAKDGRPRRGGGHGPVAPLLTPLNVDMNDERTWTPSGRTALLTTTKLLPTSK